MSRPSIVAHLVCAAGLLLAVPALARNTKAAPAAGAVVDPALGCEVHAPDLRPWEAKGVRVPSSAKAAFKLLRSVTSSNVSSAFHACKSLPETKFWLPGGGGGGIGRADLVVAERDVKVYRAYSSGPFSCSIAKPAGELGGWWSLTPLPSAKKAYRKSMAVCNSWNNFDRKVSCTLKKGAVVAVGPTQSADCSATVQACAKRPTSWPKNFGASPDHQVYINTYSPHRSQFLVDCHTEDWAGAE